MKLWIVGMLRPEIAPEAWDFTGAYDTEAAAVAACRDENYFVGPVELNATAPVEKIDWPGAYLPHLPLGVETLDAVSKGNA